MVLKREGREISMPPCPGDRVMDLLDRAGVHMDGVLVFREGIPIPLDEGVELNDRLTVVKVASGG